VAVTDLSVVPFLFMQTITDDLFGHGLRTYIKAGFAGDLPDGLIDALLERSAELRSPATTPRTPCRRRATWRRLGPTPACG
jgi:hypothetical protein